MICQYCDKECKNLNSLKQHETRCKLNPNRKIRDMSGANNPRYGKPGVNQHTKAKSEGRVIVVSKETREKLSIANTGLKWSDERKAEFSKIMLEVVKNNPDLYSASNVSGRVKTYEFQGMKFKGTWELKVADALSKMGIKYTNKLTPIEYEYNNSTHLYFPDFYLEDFDLYIEVKGYKRDRDLCKWNALKNLIILEQAEINDLENVLKDLLNNWVVTGSSPVGVTK